MNPLQRLARRLDDFQQGQQPFTFIFALNKKFGDDNAGVLVSTLAYSAFVALFPLLLVLVTVLGLVLAGRPGLRHAFLSSTFADFPIIGTELGKNVHSLHRDSVAGLVIGLAGLVWGATGVAQAGLFAMSQVWNLPGPERPNFVRRALRSFGFLAVLGAGLVVSTFLASFGTFGHHDVALGLVGEVLAAVINVAQYLLAFRVLTPRVVRTRDLVPGAIAGGIAWTVLLALGGYLIGHDLKGDSALYGLFGIVLGLVAWIYLGARISIYAAEINTVLARHLWPRSLMQPPLTPADRESLRLQSAQTQRRPEQRVDVSFEGADQSTRKRSASGSFRQ